MTEKEKYRHILSKKSNALKPLSPMSLLLLLLLLTKKSHKYKLTQLENNNNKLIHDNVIFNYKKCSFKSSIDTKGHCLLL